MIELSDITSHLEAVVASEGDESFFKKIELTLLLSSTAQIPISVRRFIPGKDEAIFTYTGIVIFADNITKKYDEEVTSATMANLFPMLVEQCGNPLLTQKALFCKISNKELIESFCDLHGLNADELRPQDCPIGCWTIYNEQVKLRLGLKPSRPLIFIQ